MLLRKMLRDMRSRKGQFISILIMSFLGVFVYAGINAEWVGFQGILEKYYEETNMADFWVYGEDLSADNVEELLEIPSVSDAALRLVVNSTAAISGTPTIMLNIADTFDISGFRIQVGDDFEEGGEGIWLDSNFAQANNLSVGDSIEFSAFGNTISQNIRALVISPEYIYSVDDSGGILPDHKGFGFGFLTTAALPDGFEQIPYNEILVTADGGAATRAAIQDTLSGVATEVMARENMSSHSVSVNEIEQHQAMGQVFPIAFLVIATLTIVTTMTRLVLSQRNQLGTLTALGYKKRKIAFHYVSYGFWLSILGSILGIILGPICLEPVFIAVNKDDYVLPQWGAELSLSIFVMAAATVVVCSIASFLAVRRTLNDMPAEALRPKGPTAFKSSVWEKTRLWARTGFNFQWNFRDVFRSRLRSFMVIIGIAGCCMLLIGSFGLYDSFIDMIDWQYDGIYNFETKIIPYDGYDIAELKSLYDAELVREAAIEISFEDDKETATLSSIDEGGSMIRYYDKKRAEMTLPDTGASISYKMAQQFGVDTGDTISWHIYGDTTWHDIEITAIHRTPFVQGIAISARQLDNLELDMSNFLVTNSYVTDEDEGISSASHISAMREDYMDALAMFYIMIGLLVTAAAILAIVVLYNLCVLSYAERERDMATLTVLGMKTGKLRRVMLIRCLVSFFQ